MLDYRRWMAGVLAASLLFLLPSAAQARWLRAESARFVLYSDGDEQVLRDYVNKLEDFDTILRASHGLSLTANPPRKMEIYLVRDIRQLRKVRPGTPETIAGFYMSGLGDVFAVAIRERGDDDADDTLLHEYTHHFMAQHMTPRFPGWMVEGYAEYFMTAKLSASKFELGLPNPGRAFQLVNARWISGETLLTRRPLELSSDDRGAYYAQAWLLTHYMKADKARFRQLQAYEAGIKAGKDSTSAWIEATGEGLEPLERKLKAYAKRAIVSTIYTRVTKMAVAPVAITTLPASADDFLLERQALRFGLSDEEGKAVLVELRRRAAQHPGDRLALATIAEAEIQFGDAAGGAAILDRMIAADPADAEALRARAIALMDAADDDSAAPWRARYVEAGKLLVRANKAQADDYRTLFAYARSRRIEADYPSENTLNVLLLAAQLAPQVAETRLEAARGLMFRKQFDEAIEMLTPVANAPHGGAAAEQARTFLRQIEAGR